MSTYGIDLGTTYSCIATLDRNGNAEVIHNNTDASDTLASAVYFETTDNVIVGSNAKDYAETDGDRVVQFVKREIGKKDGKTYTIDGVTYSPIEISKLILERLKQIVEEQGGNVTDVVITCPAYFGLEERNATKKAGELAGMNVLNLINEPTAAALSYCAKQFQEEKTIMVYDLGGGTFDVTIVKMGLNTNEDGNEVQTVTVVATGGNDRLGGADWDERLFKHIMKMCCDDNGIEESDIDVETRQVIRSKVETTKKKLTNAENAKVKVNINGTMTNVQVTREEFESITADLVAQTMSYVESVLNAAGNIPIDTVLLVGGSTYMPMIRNAVEARFPGIVQQEDPDRAVAKGAAIYASMLVKEDYDEHGNRVDDPNPPTGDPGETGGEGEDSRPNGNSGTGVTSDPFRIVDQTPRSFGPGILSGGQYVIDNLIKINTEMPARNVKVYSTVADNQTIIILRAFESRSTADILTPCLDIEGNEQPTDPADEVKYLGQLELNLPGNLPKGSPIEVTFSVEAVGVYIKAVDLTNGGTVETTLRMETDIDIDPNIPPIVVSGD